jgi:hypothetical protein
MIGGGPEWISQASEAPRNSIATVAVTEFIYAPWGNKKVRILAEPPIPTILAKAMCKRLA